MRKFFKAHGLLVGFCLTAGLGLGVGWWNAQRVRSAALEDLQEDIQRCALAFNAEEMKALRAAPEDEATPEYASVKARLMALRQTSREVRFIYIFRTQPPGGRVKFLADSEPADSKEISHAGDDYKEAVKMPGLQQIIRTNLPSSEGPVEDEWGEWVTGYALIGPPVPAGTPKEIIGMDIDAQHWRWKLWSAGVLAALYVWLLLGLPLVGLGTLRRVNAQNETIRKLLQAIEQSRSGILIYNPEGVIEYANKGICVISGYDASELIGRNWRDFRTMQTSDTVYADLERSIQAGRTWHGEWTNRRKDEGTYPVRAVVSPVFTEGKLTHIVAVLDDIGDLKRAQAELFSAKQRAEAGDRAKGQFLAMMSHEIRTPLNGIIGFASLALETSLTPEQREFVRTIRASGESLLELTDEVLDFSKIDAGHLELNLQPADPRDCVEEALDLLAARAAEKKLELLHWVEPGVPAEINIDALRLRQVLVNLIGNATKFTATGEIAVTVSVLPPGAQRLEPGEIMLEFSVRDTGIGISPGNQAKLFKPFSQVDDAVTRKYGGSGLGLAISRNLVRLMGGEITVASEAGAGSTFVFTLKARVIKPPAGNLHSGLKGSRAAVFSVRPSLRAELVRLAQSWGCRVTEPPADQPMAVPWDFALVELGVSDMAHWEKLCADEPGLAAQPLFGIVPVDLPQATREVARRYFRSLMNKPVHHGLLHRLVAGHAQPKPAPPATPTPTVHTAQKPGAGLRVLLIEDNPINQRLAAKILSNCGCEVVVADNGIEGLLRLGAATFDVVFTDLHMPMMDGVSVIKKIRIGEAGEAARRIWIVVLTADVQSSLRELSLNAGADDFLTKPTRTDQIETALRRYQATGLYH